jgi:hypothetical protein
MNFIETWLGVSPDGGNGSVEHLVLIILLLAISALASRRLLFNRWRQPKLHRILGAGPRRLKSARCFE